MIENAPPVLTKMRTKVNAVFGGYFESLPFLYGQTKKNYPLLVWIHGLGQRGNGNSDIDLLGIDGIGKLLVNGSFAPVFNVNGQYFSFIVLSPQYYNTPTTDDVMSFIDYAKKNYRIDTARIYLAGLSVGGILVSETAAKYPGALAAVAPMAGVMESGDISAKCRKIADADLPVWVFHNENDPTVPVYFPRYVVSTINNFTPPIRARLTLFNEPGHDAWSKALNAGYRENGMNVYEWMLQYHR